MTVILPGVCDDAVAVLRDAVEELRGFGGPMFVVEAFVDAYQKTSDAVRKCSEAQRMEDVEERHIEGQTFPWTEEL